MQNPGDRSPEEHEDALPRDTSSLGDDTSHARGVPDANTAAPEEAAAERLNTYVERLRTERRPSRAEAPREPLDAFEAATMLHAQSSTAAEPSADFASRLWHEMATVVGSDAATPRDPVTTNPVATAPATPDIQPPSTPTRRKPSISRRSVLTGGLATAASLAAGVAGGIALDHTRAGSTPPSATAPWPSALVPQGQWVSLFAADALALGEVRRFATDAVIGFVRRTSNGYVALSGVCTHMGCLLNWNAGERTFDCPCHGGRFTETGQTAPSSSTPYRPLPTIETKVESGQLWVFVPAGGLPASDGSQDPSGHPYR